MCVFVCVCRPDSAGCVRVCDARLASTGDVALSTRCTFFWWFHTLIYLPCKTIVSSCDAPLGFATGKKKTLPRLPWVGSDFFFFFFLASSRFTSRWEFLSQSAECGCRCRRRRGKRLRTVAFLFSGKNINHTSPSVNVVGCMNG